MLSIHDQAARKITALLLEKGLSNENHGLRIAIHGGGCSGFMYQMELSPSHEGDQVFVHEETGARVFVDPKSLLLIGGSVVNYSDALTDAGFKVENPHAKDTCGCGQSFAV